MTVPQVNAEVSNLYISGKGEGWFVCTITFFELVGWRSDYENENTVTKCEKIVCDLDVGSGNYHVE